MWSMARSNIKPLRDEVSLLAINCDEAGMKNTRFVAVSSKDGKSIAALPLVESSPGMRVTLSDEVPRLYVLFPMVTSGRLGLPAAISSLQFKPREDRDGISLSDETDGPKENRRLLGTVTTTDQDTPHVCRC